MSHVRALLFVTVLSLLARPASAQDVDERDALSHLAPVSGPVGTLVRLPLPPDVLERVAADLSDVRVLDPEGRDVPYAIDREEHVVEAPPTVRRATLTVLWASQTRTRSGAAPIQREVYRVTLPSAASGEGVSLELETAVPAFTATARVTGIGLDVRATVFRIPEMGVERLDVPLPPGTDGPIELTLESEGGPLSPHLFARVRTVPRTIERLERALAILDARVEGSAQVIELARPAGVAPVELRVRTSSASFAAPVRVLARSADAGEREIGRATLYRVTVGDQVVEQLSVAVDGAQAGDRVVLRIERGDSPPLEGVEVVAVLRAVALLFTNDPGLVLHFGGARLRRPEYDLAWLGDHLLDPHLPRASLGEVRESPTYRHEPLLGFAMRAGAEVDRTTFHHHAPLTIPAAPEGLTRVALGPELAMAAASDLSDVRVVSPDGRQWPYVVAEERREVTLEVPVERAAHPERAGWSRYTLRLPFRPLAPYRVAIDPEERFFSRALEVRGTDGEGEVHELAPGYGERDGAGGEPITVGLGERRVEVLALDVDDGSEAPLTFATAQVTLRVRDLLVTAPPGEYEVLCGDALATAPTYDLARVPARLLRNVALAEVTAGALAPNPRYHEPTFFERSGWQTVVLWIALGLSVLVLLGLTLRIARTEPEAPTPAAPAPASEAPAPAAPASEAAAPAAEAPADDDDE